ncbi:PRC-barrel domain-containing protein [Paenactinomyces guangxiensis]|uniref:PRC-barrel domain-containing protein n=1 Tax=Paenactinomyces guangxiensis TaxID=1490290 RepID=A0A7W2A7P8_9BACL|nr:PRC-barrel domain-containing protein [Paenactinomyces guangxiensis]MBA4493008.1 PRC-barrel domain-containing protein [Paenactinomyces guangxiensis]MBH8590143.1 PRC-barrel domain-containing protein [Paenactinomyces guangxiensis]
MRKSQEVIGLSVVHLHSGKKLGTVCDLLFDGSQQLRGLLVENGSFFKKRRYIPADRVTSIGKDAVIVDNKDAILPLDPIVEQWTGILSGQKKLKGRSVLLSNGYEIGMIENVYFLEEMGTLIGYEISDGILSDLRQGRKMLKSSQPLIWGEDVLIAPADQVQVQDAR